MKALRLLEWKHEAELVEVPEPTPGPGEVVIRVAGAGACHSDLHVMYEFEAGALPWTPPFTLGHENAGWVDQVGAGVRGVSVGEAVAVYGPWGCGRCQRCATGMENYCERQGEIGAYGGGLGLDGGMAPLLLVPHARWLVPLGDLDPVQAAPLTDAGLTPYHAVKRSLHLLGAGSTAVVIGVGGLGQMAVQMLKVLSGATVIAVDARDSALRSALALGADHVVNANASANETIAELTHGRLADVVLDMVGSDETLALASKAVRPLGHLTLVGLAGGTLPFSFFGLGYEVGVASTYWGSLPELYEVIQLAQTKTIQTRVTRYALDDAVTAYRDLRAGAVDGRAVVVPS